MTLVNVHTPTCWVCHEDGLIAMPAEAYTKWATGAFIQDAWPEGSEADREQLISGTHEKCWDVISPDDDG